MWMDEGLKTECRYAQQKEGTGSIEEGSIKGKKPHEGDNEECWSCYGFNLEETGQMWQHHNTSYWEKAAWSYERLKPNTWSGAYHCWGKENREAPIRTACPPGISSEVVSNFEIKAFDGCANPYLGLAAVIAAGIDGLRKHLVLPEPVDTNPDDLEEGAVHRLPTSLDESVTELRKNEVLKNFIGDNLINEIIAVREAEIRYYSAILGDNMEKLIVRY